jgi:tRNA threonylcarbamoyladenosine biosynthesis protein TsaE
LETTLLQLNTLTDTEKLGRLLGTSAEPGDVICLDGDLGAGKTALCQAIARGLQVPENCYVTSPSFAILHEYAGRMPMYHMDFYRLQDSVEVEDLGFEEYFYLQGLTVIEWSGRALEILPGERMSLAITLKKDQSRSVLFRATGRYGEKVQRIINKFNEDLPENKTSSHPS